MNVQRSGRPAEGGVLDVPGRGRCEVVSNADPSVIVLRTESGATFKIGEKALALALVAVYNDTETTR